MASLRVACATSSPESRGLARTAEPNSLNFKFPVHLRARTACAITDYGTENPDLIPAGYAAWLAELKTLIRTACVKASLAVNRELIQLYWRIGNDIVSRQDRQSWGAKVIDQLAKNLRHEFPEMTGLSPTNLKYMRRFAETRPKDAMGQQLVDPLP
jgi:hypothetical protein